ncbi:MAG: phosphotransferase family protein [Solirubrobacterales bacterium]
MIEDLLSDWAVQEYGPGWSVDCVAPMPGNAGLSFGFNLHEPGGRLSEALVIRFAPPGVRRSGATDVLAQVPILRGLGERSLPVAPLRWYGDESGCLGIDAFVVARLPGRPFHMTEEVGSATPGPGGPAELFDRAVDALAVIHAVPWAELHMKTEGPRSLAAEIDLWGRLLRRVEDPPHPAAAQLEADLMATMRTDVQVGLFHGDFQTNNLLFEKGRLTGILDWELAGVGAQLLDLGWLAMMTDPASWEEGYRTRLRTVSDRESLRLRYELTSGRAVPNFDWFVALACFRFGAILSYNTMLHRTGRRPDPLYDLMAPSFPCLLERGSELISNERKKG